MTADEAAARPRVTGERERQILDATLDVLADVGYDRLTMDAVAASARASKATLYRRWTTKAVLVIDALRSIKEPPALPDTGTLRGDLLEVLCGMGGFFADQRSVTVFASVLTAIARDQELAVAFRRDIVGPKISTSQLIWERARERGEIRDDIDLSLFEPAAAGIVLHRVFVLGQRPSPELVAAVVDQIILPAALRPAPPSKGPS